MPDYNGASKACFVSFDYVHHSAGCSTTAGIIEIISQLTWGGKRCKSRGNEEAELEVQEQERGSAGVFQQLGDFSSSLGVLAPRGFELVVSGGLWKFHFCETAFV